MAVVAYLPADIGTREQHLYDLLEIWQEAGEFLAGMPKNVARDNKLEELEIAVTFLRRTIEGGQDREHMEWFYRKEINNVYRYRDTLIQPSTTQD